MSDLNNNRPHPPTPKERIELVKKLLKAAERSGNYVAAADYRAQLRGLEGKK